MNTLLTDIKLDEVSLVDKGANQEAQVVLMKRDDNFDNNPEGENMSKEFEDKIAELEKKLQDSLDTHSELEKKATDAEAKVAELSKVDEVQEEQIDKSALPEVVVKQLEAFEKASQMQNAEITKMRDKIALDGWTEKVAKLGSISTDVELAQVMKNIADVASAEDVAAIEKVLAGANEAVAKGELFVEKGSSAEGSFDDAWGKLEKAADQLMTNDANLTKESAIAKAMDVNPALYTEYMEGK
jgi:hypothetical protein